jgi:hypothetical protein
VVVVGLAIELSGGLPGLVWAEHALLAGDGDVPAVVPGCFRSPTRERILMITEKQVDAAWQTMIKRGTFVADFETLEEGELFRKVLRRRARMEGWKIVTTRSVHKPTLVAAGLPEWAGPNPEEQQRAVEEAARRMDFLSRQRPRPVV